MFIEFIRSQCGRMWRLEVRNLRFSVNRRSDVGVSSEMERVDS